MTLDKQHGEFYFLCDGDKCHESLETGTDHFGEAQAFRKRKGWAAWQDQGEWFHFCKDCKHDY